jgi:hypothetical protein
MLSVSTSAKNLLPIRCISDGKDHTEVINAHQLFSALTPCLKWWRGVVKWTARLELHSTELSNHQTLQRAPLPSSSWPCLAMLEF